MVQSVVQPPDLIGSLLQQALPHSAAARVRCQPASRRAEALGSHYEDRLRGLSLTSRPHSRETGVLHRFTTAGLNREPASAGVAA